MREIPASAILTFPAPNYTDPQTRGKALVVVNSIFIAIVAIAIALRLYTRIYIARWFGLDDVLIILAFMSSIGLMAIVTLANARYGWNRHIWDVPFSLIPEAGKAAFAAKLLFSFASTFTRLSLLTFYYRVLGPIKIRWFTWALHASVAYNIAILISFACLVIWLCNPPSAYWVYPPPPGACLDEGKVVLASGIITCVADLLVTILPIPIIARLQMPTRKRLAIILLLSVGFLVTVAGIVRTYYIWKGLFDSYDQTWYTYPLWISAAVEIDLAVICACVPYLRPLFTRFLGPKVKSIGEKVSSLISSNRSSSNKSADRSAPPTNPTDKGNSTTELTKIEEEDIPLADV